MWSGSLWVFAAPAAGRLFSGIHFAFRSAVRPDPPNQFDRCRDDKSNRHRTRTHPKKSVHFHSPVWLLDEGSGKAGVEHNAIRSVQGSEDTGFVSGAWSRSRLSEPFVVSSCCP
jgi:hypothetical protein